MKQISERLSASKLSHKHLRDTKHKLKFQLTPDCTLPLQTKKPQQVLLTLVRQRNSKTGEERRVVKEVKPIQFEFESDALCDFAYQLDGSAKVSNKELKEQALLRGSTGGAGELAQAEEETIKLMAPSQFVFGKLQFSQAKEKKIKQEFALRP